MSCVYLRVVCGGHAAGVASGHDHMQTLGHGRVSASRPGYSSVFRCRSESERLSGVETATQHRQAREPSRPPHERREPRVLGCSTVCRCTRTRGSRRMGRLRSWASIHRARSSSGAASLARSTPEPHGGIIAGWRALRSAHGDTDPVPVEADIRPPPGVDRVDEKVYHNVTGSNGVA
jgi:hypothetical protein